MVEKGEKKDMPDREKTIRALEGIGVALDMEGHHNDAQAVRDALALLKEQEARVMKWDELMKLANGDPAFLETRDWSCRCWALVCPTYMGWQHKNGYGVRWRYWTSRPTPEQMLETKWEGEENHGK